MSANNGTLLSESAAWVEIARRIGAIPQKGGANVFLCRQVEQLRDVLHAIDAAAAKAMKRRIRQHMALSVPRSSYAWNIRIDDNEHLPDDWRGPRVLAALLLAEEAAEEEAP